MAVLFSDLFPYSDGSLPTVSSGVYAKPSSWANACAVLANKAKGAASGDNAVHLPGYSGSTTSQWSAVTVSTYSDFMGPTCFNNGVGDFYFLETRPTAWRFYRINAGGFTEVKNFAQAGLVAGDEIRLEVDIVGGNPVLTAKRNGVAVDTYTDTSGSKLTSGTPGFRIWDTTARVGKFEAGDFTTPPAGGITRVQGTAKQTGSGTSFTFPAFASPPTVGNAIILPVSLWFSADTKVITGVTDNFGNVYAQAVGPPTPAGPGSASVWYCAKVAASGAPFTITATLAGSNFYVTSAIEVTGVGTGLAVDQSKYATNVGSTTAATGTTAALAGPDAFVVAVLNATTTQSSITVESVSPSWTQEYEELSTTNTAGEADSRSLASTAGQTVSCSWVLNPSSASAQAVVAFKAGVVTGALARVQAAAQVAVVGASSITVPFSTPPTAGNAIIIPVVTSRDDSHAGLIGTAVDSQGNPFTLATSGVVAYTTLSKAAAIFYLTRLPSVGGAYSVTVSFGASTVVNAVASGIEVSGGGNLAVEAVTPASSSSGSTAAATGTSAASTVAELFNVAVLGTTNSMPSIVVESVSPTWTEEFEHRPVPFDEATGEADSRIRLSQTGVTQSCSWTLGSGTRPWVAVLAAFKGTPLATPARTSQAVTELLNRPTPTARTSHLVVEILTASTRPRVSQVATELLHKPLEPGRVSHMVVEVLSLTPIPVAVPNVVGMTLAAATAALTSANLTVGTVAGPTTTIVASQTPVAGALVLAGSAVDLLMVALDPSNITVLPTTLPNPVTGVPYAESLSAIGGDGGPYTFSVLSGTLPEGLLLTTGGLISGTPVGSFILTPAVGPNGLVDTAYSQQLAVGGTGQTFTVRASDGSGNIGDQSYTLTVGGDWADAVFTVVPGNSFPGCLRLSQSGLVSGKPLTVGTFVVPVSVTHGGLTMTGTYTFLVKS